MKRMSYYNIIFLVAFLFGGVQYSTANLRSAALLKSANIKETEEWTEFKTFGGIKIEYRYFDCQEELVYNERLVIFRFTNTTNKKLKLSWTTEVWRNGECYNCDRLDSEEHKHELKFKPNEVITGDCSKDPALHVFANFIKLYPGMSEQELTDIKFIKLERTTW